MTRFKYDVIFWALLVLAIVVMVSLNGCLNMQSKQISTEENVWLEDPKSSELLYCKTKVTFSEAPVCYVPRRITSE